jgi:hypothetical protein
MSKRSIPAATRRRVLAAYEAGTTDPVALSCKCLVTLTVVNAVLAEVAADEPAQAPAPRGSVDADRVMALLAEGMAPKDVAAACGCSVHNVYKIRRRAAASATEVRASDGPDTTALVPLDVSSSDSAGASDPHAPATFSGSCGVGGAKRELPPACPDGSGDPAGPVPSTPQKPERPAQAASDGRPRATGTMTRRAPVTFPRGVETLGTISDGGRKPAHDRDPVGCRWIDGDVRKGWRYCQGEIAKGAYCAHHHGRAYQGQPAKVPGVWR